MQTAAGGSGPEERTPAQLGLVLILFLISGFAALLYQVTWQRILGFFSGTDIYSATITVSAFMGGLGCGNLAGGYIADRLSYRRSIVLFALAELSIALFALASKWIYYDFLYLRFPELGQNLPLLSATLFVSLLVPTFFMGLSLPLLAKAFTRRISLASTTIGRLYGVNTLGAAAGALVTAFVLMRFYGFETTLWIGAALNASCGLAALGLLAFAPAEQSVGEAKPVEQESSAPAFPFPLWCIIYATSGFIALSLEIVWFRLIGIVMKASTFSFGILLFSFLSGLALGTFVGIWWAKRSGNLAARFFALQAGVILYAVLSLVVFLAFVDQLPILDALWTYLGEDLDVSSVAWDFTTAVHFVVPLVLIAPATFLMGASFPILQELIQTEHAFIGRRVGGIQTSNIAGSMLGSILTGLVFLHVLGITATLQLVVALGGACLIAAVVVYTVGWPTSRRALATAVAAALAAGVVVLVPSNAAIWGKLHGTEVGHFVFSEDRTGVTLIRDAGTGRHLVLSNGKGLSWIPFGGPHTALGALPALLHPDPKRIAVIGLGSGDTCFSAGGNSASEEIVCIEITSSQVPVLEAFQRETPNESIATLFQDPRFHHEATDGRAFVLRSREPFDIIELDPQSPNTAYTGNLYSYEFFDLMRRRLAPGGFAVTHRSTPRAIRAFVRAFPHLLAVGFDRRYAVLIGSNEPIHFDRRALLAKVRSDWQLREYYASAGVDIVRLFSGMVERPIGFLARYAGGGEYNTDLFPRDEFMTPERPAPKDAHSPPLAGPDAKASSRATRRRRPDRR